MNKVSFMEVPSAIRAQISAEIMRVKKAKPILISRQSNHPDDRNIFSVIGHSNDTDFYHVWTYNSSCQSLYCGHYDLSFRDALYIYSMYCVIDCFKVYGED